MFISRYHSAHAVFPAFLTSVKFLRTAAKSRRKITSMGTFVTIVVVLSVFACVFAADSLGNVVLQRSESRLHSWTSKDAENAANFESANSAAFGNVRWKPSFQTHTTWTPTRSQCQASLRAPPSPHRFTWRLAARSTPLPPWPAVGDTCVCGSWVSRSACVFSGSVGVIIAKTCVWG